MSAIQQHEGDMSSAPEQVAAEPAAEPAASDIAIELNTSPPVVTDHREWLIQWSLRHRITHAAIDDILQHLHNTVGLDVPLRARTLFASERTAPTGIRSCPPGHYFHFGIEPALRSLLTFLPPEQVNFSDLHLDMNTDGVPVYRSNTKSFWAVLGAVREIPNSVFIIGCYFGDAKPNCSNSLLQDLVSDFLRLPMILVAGREYRVTPGLFRCDTPARYFVKKIKSFNGYYGCDRCYDEGVHPRGHAYTDTTCQRRSDALFRQRDHPVHHLGDPPSHSEWYSEQFGRYPTQVSSLGAVNQSASRGV